MTTHYLRLSLKIDSLVNKILDKIPEHNFVSSTTTFFDPAIGGGQFLKGIENRLRQYGHSDKNIASRLFGIVDHPKDINYVRNKNKILGTLTTGSLKELEKMAKKVKRKFDVILGNPPYQSGKGNGSHPIYRKFITNSMLLLNEDGFLAMVSPPGFLNTSKFGVESDVFAKLKAGNLIHVQLTGVGKYFDVGSPICYIIWNKASYNGRTTINSDLVVNLEEHFFIPRIFNANIDNIIRKMSSSPDKLSFLYRKKVSGICVRFKELNHISAKKGNMKAEIANGYDTKYSYNVSVKTVSEANHLLSFLNSSAFSFLNYVIRYNSVIHNGMICGFSLPPETVDTLDDKELYAHFNFTQEEIDYIEETIK